MRTLTFVIVGGTIQVGTELSCRFEAWAYRACMDKPFQLWKKDGTYSCAYCGHELFDSDSKYDLGSGWPSFWRSIDNGAMSYKMEFDGRLECTCGKCNSQHLGHVFLHGPRQSDVPQDLLSSSPSTDLRSKRENAALPRFCVNGASMRLNESSQ